MNKETYKPNEDIDLAHTLSFDSHTGYLSAQISEGDEEKSLTSIDSTQIVSCISWNCTGGCIAVGYCHKIHEEMCSHHSEVAIWSLFTKSFTPNKPTLILDSPVCFPTYITTIVVHNRCPISSKRSEAIGRRNI